ncbi:hypothetical protein D3C76_51910 [compost metagenome]
MSVVSELVKIGVCSTVDFESGTITATFPDRQDVVTKDMPVILAGGYGAQNSLPKPGDTVLCLMLGNGLSNGVCLGVIQDFIPGSATQEGVFFEDGSHIFYDRESGAINIKAVGGAVIESPENVTVKAKNVTAEAENVTIKAVSVTIDGNLAVTGTVSAANIGG